MAKISPARSRLVFRAIKAAILKGEDVEYWTLKMYEQAEAGVLTDEQVAELEELIEAYWERQDEPQPEPEPETIEGE